MVRKKGARNLSRRFVVKGTVGGLVGSSILTGTAAGVGVLGPPEGSSVATEADVIQVDHEWKTVSLSDTYWNPVVFVGPVSYNEWQPATMQVRKKTAESFETRVREREYLDGVHLEEEVGYLVLNGGGPADRAQTGNGTSPVDVNVVVARNPRQRVKFGANFSEKPVVITQIQTQNADNTVVPRIRGLSTTEMFLQLREFEAQGAERAIERVGYFAVEPGIGQFGGRKFEAGRERVDNRWCYIEFEQEYREPVVLATPQTTNGPDPVSVRARDRDESGVSLRLEGEESRNSEQEHRIEEVGYLVFEAAETS